MRHWHAYRCGCLVALMAATLASPSSAASPSLDWSALADVLVARMSLQPGESVLVVAARGRFEPLVERLRAAVQAAGAQDLGVVAVAGEQPPAWRTSFTDDAAQLEGDALVRHLHQVDVALMFPGATPADAAYAAMQEVLRSGAGRTVHLHWEGAFRLDGDALEPDGSIDAFYERVLRQTDYAALAVAQRDFADAMRQAEVRVTTPAGTDLRFRIGDRPVTRQDGDASAARARLARNLIDREVELPAGAIRVAPLESSVQGTIAFPPSLWAGERVEGLLMQFRDGRLVDWSASVGGDGVAREIEAGGEAARAFRELAVGLNPLLAIPADRSWIPYYGYGAGVVRLSLGDNGELGGEVRGGYVRWNFFTDVTLAIGDHVWIRDGAWVGGR